MTASDFAPTDAVALRLVLAVLGGDSDAVGSTLNELGDDNDGLREVARFLAGMVQGVWVQCYGESGRPVFIASIELALAATLDAMGDAE